MNEKINKDAYSEVFWLYCFANAQWSATECLVEAADTPQN
jgi:hypothetical protein